MPTGYPGLEKHAYYISNEQKRQLVIPICFVSIRPRMGYGHPVLKLKMFVLTMTNYSEKKRQLFGLCGSIPLNNGIKTNKTII